MKTKFFAITAAITLLLFQNSYASEQNSSLTPKQAEYLSFAGYSVLGLFSFKQVINSVFRSALLFSVQKAINNFDDSFFDDSYTQSPTNNIKAIFAVTHIYNLAKATLFAYLTYFSVKRLKKMFNEAGKDNQEEENKETAQKEAISL